MSSAPLNHSESQKTTVHITPHVHWDREWYFTAEQSRILLLNDMDEVISRLENDPDYPFYVLDGQTAILEDYLFIKPENETRIAKLVQEGRLIIGPWYSQTDTMIVGAESIVRNLLYGMQDCEKFGSVMKIGYLPDSFSMSAQLPHIYNGFDIYRSLFWRGCSERHGTNKTEFIWKTEDDSAVFNQILPLGYAIGKYLPDDDDGLKKRLDDYFKVLEKSSLTKDILLPNGHDQMPIQNNIFDIIERLKRLYPEKEFQMTRFETVFEKIEAMQKELDEVKGEFNDGKYMRVHRTISSTRMDIKLLHVRTENAMTNILEPLASLAYQLGFEYQSSLIQKIWKELLKSHAHDSIGCCCSDIVHKQIFNRFELAEDMAQNLIQFYMRKIVDHQPQSSVDENRIVFFNLSPYERNEVLHATIRIKAKAFTLVDQHNREIPYSILKATPIDPGLIDRQIVHYGNYDPFMEYQIQLLQPISAMGYTSYRIIPSEIEVSDKHESATTVLESNQFENQFYHILVNQDGTLTITDKQTKQCYQRALRFENGSDDGDEYDYSPLVNDWLCYQNETDVKAITIVKQPYQTKATISIQMPVPADLKERAQHKASKFIELNMQVTLAECSKRIDIDITINNQALDQRLRVLIPTPYQTDSVITDNQFGTIVRPISDPAMTNWESEKWKEAPIPVWQFLNFAVLQEKNASNKLNGLALLTQGSREFEIIQDPEGNQKNTFALTLFRSVGLLGKENLKLRPGRPSGIKMETPDSQMLGEHPFTYSFSLIGFDGSWEEAHIAQQARDYTTPILAYNKIPFDALKLNKTKQITPLSYSLLSFDSSDVVLSSLKKSEKSDGLIIRSYNPSQAPLVKSDSVHFTEEVKEWREVKLNEMELNSSPKMNALGTFKPCQSKSFEVILAKHL